MIRTCSRIQGKGVQALDTGICVCVCCVFWGVKIGGGREYGRQPSGIAATGSPTVKPKRVRHRSHLREQSSSIRQTLPAPITWPVAHNRPSRYVGGARRARGKHHLLRSLRHQKRLATTTGVRALAGQQQPRQPVAVHKFRAALSQIRRGRLDMGLRTGWVSSSTAMPSNSLSCVSLARTHRALTHTQRTHTHSHTIR